MGNDDLCLLQRTTKLVMTVMTLEPAVMMGRIAEETEVMNLHRPLACPIVIISFHRTVLIYCKFNVFLAYSNYEKDIFIYGMCHHSHVHGNASISRTIQ